jgi:1,4-dihydroxy-2-naphthoate octaprenyltransferase
VAASEGEARALPALAALVAALLIQVGTNFANDADDFDRGADSGARAGPLRAAQAGLLSTTALRAATFAAFAGAALIGLYLIERGGWPIAVLGLLALLAGYAYTGGPLPLGYRGLGDPLVFLFFGVFAVWGTHRVQTPTPSELALAASVPIGLLATALIAVNNLRDIETDRSADKRTLAVRLGPRGARRYYALLLAGSYAALPALWWLGAPPGAAALPLLTAPLAWRLWRKVQAEEGPSLNRALAGTARLELGFASAMAVGLVL